MRSAVAVSLLFVCASACGSPPASTPPVQTKASSAATVEAQPATTSAPEKVAPAVEVPKRVVVDADTALIAPDPGGRVIEALVANSAALDGCLTDAVQLLDSGAKASMRITVDQKGKLTEIELERRVEMTTSDNVGECMRKVLGKIDFGPSDVRRSGFLFFKADPPLNIRTDPDADVAKVEKTNDGLTYSLEARRVKQANGEFHLGLAVNVTNTGKAPRGVRTILYSNDEAQRNPDANIAHSGVLHTDDTLPITCLQPGKSVRIESKQSRLDPTIAQGGRRYSDVFLVAGDCDVAATRVMLGGARLTWKQGEPKPTVVALPYWVHQLDPFEPRQSFRMPPVSEPKK
ncbi:MAG: hypothetical protein HOW73_09550 [Polyangiaceae bacterium]|nr:hypothetical protein [Polyangiaceae bacterium]